MDRAALHLAPLRGVERTRRVDLSVAAKLCAASLDQRDRAGAVWGSRGRPAPPQRPLGGCRPRGWAGGGPLRPPGMWQQVATWSALSPPQRRGRSGTPLSSRSAPAPRCTTGLGLTSFRDPPCVWTRHRALTSIPMPAQSRKLTCSRSTISWWKPWSTRSIRTAWSCGLVARSTSPATWMVARSPWSWTASLRPITATGSSRRVAPSAHRGGISPRVGMVPGPQRRPRRVLVDRPVAVPERCCGRRVGGVGWWLLPWRLSQPTKSWRDRPIEPLSRPQSRTPSLRIVGSAHGRGIDRRW
jgi:hypothetical protein